MRRSDGDLRDQRRDQEAEPRLFDLPLDLPERERPAHPRTETPRPAERPRSVERAPELPLAAAGERPARPLQPVAVPPPSEPEEEGTPGARGTVRSRLAAGFADVVIHATLVVVAAGGARLLGAAPRLADWPPIAAFLTVFSFLYTVLPLAFWGQTLGMAWAGLSAQSRDGEALTFDQAARRWLGALLTAATLGLPILLAGRGRTLSDRLSGSTTYPAD